MTIRRLGASDLVHVWAEGPGTPLQIALLLVLDGPPGGGEAFDQDRARKAVADRLPPALRARVRWTRWHEGPPAWVDAEPDLTHHVTATALPDGAGEPELLRWSAARAVERLPLDRPLWRIDFATGLEGGRVGLLLVMHHVLADGVTGMAIARGLLDNGPYGPAATPAAAAAGMPCTSAALRRDHARRLLRGAVTALRRLPATLAALTRTLARLRTLWGELAPLAPITRLGRSVGPTRRLAVVRRRLEDVRAIGHAHGATVNDVVLAAVAAGLRRWLAARGDDVEPLVLRASVPMAVEAQGTNRIDFTIVPLPLAGDDDTARLATIAATTRARKALRAAGTAATMSLPLPALLGRAWVRWLRREGSRRVNLYVTNVPGPRGSLWFAGARVRDAVPIVPLADGLPLGVGVISLGETLAIALHADGSVAELDALGLEVDRALARLCATIAREPVPALA